MRPNKYLERSRDSIRSDFALDERELLVILDRELATVAFSLVLGLRDLAFAARLLGGDFLELVLAGVFRAADQQQRLAGRRIAHALARRLEIGRIDIDADIAAPHAPGDD